MNFFRKVIYRLHDKKQLSSGSVPPSELTMIEENSGYSSGVFVNSLDSFSARDVVLNEVAAKKKPSSGFDVVRLIIYWICIAVFCVSAYMLIDNLIQKQKGKDIYDKLEQDFLSQGFDFGLIDPFAPNGGGLGADAEGKPTPSISEMLSGNGSNVSIGQYNEELAKMIAGLNHLAEINPDIYGWIRIAGTNINYPIVQGKDNDYYLDHAYTGEPLVLGSIFADYRVSNHVEKNYNTVLYGHNLTDGNMFHDVTKFFRDDYFYGTYIYIYTFDGIYVFEPFAIYETRYDYNYFKTHFATSSGFVAFAEEIHSNSAKYKDMDFTADDRLLTL